MPLTDKAGNDTYQRIAEIAALHLQGWGVPGIAKHLGCSHATVWSNLRALREFWLESAQQSMAQRQAEELARLSLVEADAWAHGDRKSVLKVIETRLRMFRMIGPTTVVQQTVQIAWDAIQGAADAGEPPDVIEERLAEASIPHLEARLNGQGSREDAGAGEAAGGE
jgi:hypothetical protein